MESSRRQSTATRAVELPIRSIAATGQDCAGCFWSRSARSHVLRADDECVRINLTNNDVLTTKDQSSVDDGTLRSWTHTDGFGRTVETWSRDPQGDDKVSRPTML